MKVIRFKKSTTADIAKTLFPLFWRRTRREGSFWKNALQKALKITSYFSVTPDTISKNFTSGQYKTLKLYLASLLPVLWFIFYPNKITTPNIEGSVSKKLFLSFWYGFRKGGELIFQAARVIPSALNLIPFITEFLNSILENATQDIMNRIRNEQIAIVPRTILAFIFFFILYPIYITSKLFLTIPCRTISSVALFIDSTLCLIAKTFSFSKQTYFNEDNSYQPSDLYPELSENWSNLFGALISILGYAVIAILVASLIAATGGTAIAFPLPALIVGLKSIPLVASLASYIAPLFSFGTAAAAATFISISITVGTLLQILLHGLMIITPLPTDTEEYSIPRNHNDRANHPPAKNKSSTSKIFGNLFESDRPHSSIPTHTHSTPPNSDAEESRFSSGSSSDTHEPVNPSAPDTAHVKGPPF